MKALNEWEALLSSYSEEKRQWDRTYPWIGYVLRPVSFLITIPFFRLGITANQVTALTGFLGFAACVLLAWGTPLGFLLGGICVSLLNLFDCVDGNLARLSPSNGPPVGKFYDQLVGDVFPLVYFFLGIGLARTYQSWTVTFVIAGGATTILRLIVVQVRGKFQSVLGTALNKARTVGRLPTKGHAYRWYTRCYYNITDIQGHDFLLWISALSGWLPHFLGGSLLLATLDFSFTLIFYITRAASLQERSPEQRSNI